MSDIDGSPYDDSSGEIADTDYGDTRTRLAATELADEPPAEPLDRDEYADYVRQEPAADIGYDTSDDYDTASPDGFGWSDPADRVQGMTREEYADSTREGPAAEPADYDPDDGHDAGDIGQPGDAQPESAWSDPAEDALGLTRAEYADHVRQEPAALDDDASPQVLPDRGVPENDNPYLRLTIVQATPADRTLGDTTPTGIGLKPTGEQLSRMEDDSRSPLEKLRSQIYDRADDISDSADEYGGTLGKLFEHPPTETHTEVPSTPHDAPSHQEQGVDGGHLATAGLVVGILGFELFRAIKNKTEAWRRR
jgi:hypothetical protein